MINLIHAECVAAMRKLPTRSVDLNEVEAGFFVSVKLNPARITV